MSIDQKQSFSKTFPQKSLFLKLHPPQAWMPILGLVIFTLLGILAGGGSMMRPAYIVGSFVVGLFLYFRYTFLYIGFTWWLWFLTPLVARLIDYQSGWDDQRLIQVSPYLVTLLTLYTFFRHFYLYRHESLPFILAIASVFYGLLVGLITNSYMPAVRSFLDWITPLSFGYHLFINWRDYPSYRQTIQRTFLWGVLVMSVYGIFQYLIAPEWDRFWLIESKMYTSCGSPEPLGIRVWSTMQSPGPFAAIMSVGLLLLFSRLEPLSIPTAVVGFLAFLLTLVRSAWGVYLLTLFISFPFFKERFQMRMFIALLVVLLSVVPLTTINYFSEKINSRVQTLSNLEEDNSFNSRRALLSQGIDSSLLRFIGSGLGGRVTLQEDTNRLEVKNLDSGILDLFNTLGWVGALPYTIGLFLLFLTSLINFSLVRLDPFMNISRALGLSYFSLIIFGNTFIGISGMILWGFLGISIAGCKYYQYKS
jgi:hypothetical protein